MVVLGGGAVSYERGTPVSTDIFGVFSLVAGRGLRARDGLLDNPPWPLLLVKVLGTNKL